MRKTRIAAVMALGCLVLASGALADVISVTLLASADHEIRSDNDYTSGASGTDILLNVGTFFTEPNYLHRRNLLRFDLSALPAGIEIVSAKLQMRRVLQSSTDPQNVSVYAVLRDWNELGTTAATWTYAKKAASSWSVGGADGVGSDRAAAASDTVDVLATQYPQWNVTADVQGFITAPASNFGWILAKPLDQTVSWVRFYSREAATIDGNKPNLIIEYRVIPEPASLSLLLGGVLMIRRGSRHG